MRRRLFWLLALGGIVWLYMRRGARRPEPVAPAPTAPTAEDPAEELRRKLGETKERSEAPADAPPPADAPAPPAPDEIDAIRESVHERARAAADEMRRSSSD